MSRSLSHIVCFCFLATMFVLTACGGSSGQPTSGNTTPITVDKGVVPEGGGGGSEGSFTLYTDSVRQFSINRPTTWTQDTNFTNGVKFVGGDDSMVVEFPSAPNVTDLMTYAKSDVITYSTTLPGFKQVSLTPSTEVANAVVLNFESSGTSAVTGKAYTARGDRYYVQTLNGHLAIVTVNGPSNHYDREGIRDITLSLKVTK